MCSLHDSPDEIEFIKPDKIFSCRPKTDNPP